MKIHLIWSLLLYLSPAVQNPAGYSSNLANSTGTKDSKVAGSS